LNDEISKQMITPRDDDDFEATIRILGPEEGGRQTPAYNGIKWDFAYAEDRQGPQELNLFMIYPLFYDQQHQLYQEVALPIRVELNATMHILVEEMKEAVHRHRMKVGTRFHCHEGRSVAATGVITRITGLFK